MRGNAKEKEQKLRDMRRRAIAASWTAANVFLTVFATPCAQGDAHAPKGEISVQNVLEEINKGFKTSAHDDKVSVCPHSPHFCKYLQEDALQSFDSAWHARECTCFSKSNCPPIKCPPILPISRAGNPQNIRADRLQEGQQNRLPSSGTATLQPQPRFGEAAGSTLVRWGHSATVSHVFTG